MNFLEKKMRRLCGKVFYYLREYREVETFDSDGEDILLDFTDLTLLERLVLSAVLTWLKLSQAKDIKKIPKETLVKILFAGKGVDQLPLHCLKDYASSIGEILVKRAKHISWLEDNFSKKSQLSSKHTEVFMISIDPKLLFTTRLGSKGTSLDSLAWRAFALAAARSKSTKISEMKTLHIYNWRDASFLDINDLTFEQLEALGRCRYVYIKAAKKWMASAGVKGNWDGNRLTVEGLEEAAPTKKIVQEAPKAAPEQKAEAKEPAKEELPDKQEKPEERTDFQKYCDERLIEDSFEIERKWKRAKKELEAKKIDPAKFMLKCEKELKIKETLNSIAKKYCGEKACESSISDHFARGEYLALAPGKDYRDFKDELTDYSKQLWTACESDEEDERAFKSETFRAYCLIYLKKFYNWLLKLSRD